MFKMIHVPAFVSLGPSHIIMLLYIQYSYLKSHCNYNLDDGDDNVAAAAAVAGGYCY